MLAVGLDVNTIGNEFSLFLEVFVFFSEQVGETPLFGNNNSLLTGEFVLGSS